MDRILQLANEIHRAATQHEFTLTFLKDSIIYSPLIGQQIDILLEDSHVDSQGFDLREQYAASERVPAKVLGYSPH